MLDILTSSLAFFMPFSLNFSRRVLTSFFPIPFPLWAGSTAMDTMWPVFPSLVTPEMYPMI